MRVLECSLISRDKNIVEMEYASRSIQFNGQVTQSGRQSRARVRSNPDWADSYGGP